MSTDALIQGVSVRPLKVIADQRGAVLHMLRNDSPEFRSFGEMYFSEVNPGQVKAWKKHLRMTQHFSVPSGMLKLVIYDPREASPTSGNVMEIIIGRDSGCYQLVCIPPELWYGFSALGDSPALLANCADIPHDPTESVAIGIDALEIPYTW